MKVSIFIRSFEGDFPWLTYCLKSIHKFAHGFHEIVVAIPEGSKLDLTKERIVYVKAGKDDYVRQMSDKLNADLYCEGGAVLNLDSDTILIKSVTPEDFMYLKAVAGHYEQVPLWLMTPIQNVLSNDPNTHAWKRCMTKFSGIEPSMEYMRRIGQLIPKCAYGCFRDFCQRKHNKTFEQWASEQNREVSEFNLIGQFLHLNFPDLIHFHDTTYGIPESVVKQYWSRGGLTDEIRAEMEEILK